MPAAVSRGQLGVQDDGAAGSHTAWTCADRGSPPTLSIGCSRRLQRLRTRALGRPWPPHRPLGTPPE